MATLPDINYDAPCARCGEQPNRITDAFCSDSCAEQAVAATSAPEPERDRPRVVRLVVVQGEQLSPEDEELLVAYPRPAVRGDCEPRPCPACQHRVAMHLAPVPEEAPNAPLEICCPDCEARVMYLGSASGWCWVPYAAAQAAASEAQPGFALALRHCRPCAYVGCAHHLYLDAPDGPPALRFNFSETEPHNLVHSCGLDEADRGGLTLEEVGKRVSLTRERVRQVVEEARRTLKKNTNPMFAKTFIDVEDLNDLPDLRHPLQDVEG